MGDIRPRRRRSTRGHFLESRGRAAVRQEADPCLVIAFSGPPLCRHDGGRRSRGGCRAVRLLFVALDAVGQERFAFGAPRRPRPRPQSACTRTWRDIYPAAAVKHSFRTALGQTVDCVDFFAMPGVRAMAARGEPITAMPAPPPPQPRRLRNGTVVIDPPAPPPVSEGLDEDGNDRICPAGTVLQIRVTPEQIARRGASSSLQALASEARRRAFPLHASSHVSATQGAPSHDVALRER